MKIKTNGEQQNINQASPTIVDLLVLNKVESPDLVTVQVNGNFVDRKLFNTTQLQENDEVDFLYYLGGGRGQ